MTAAYIGLGSNLEQPAEQLGRALQALGQLAATTLAGVSPWYSSAAVGPGDQPDYLNAVAKLHTGQRPEQLLKSLQAIERAQGRTRDTRWGPRTLDLDILLYDQLQLDIPGLQIPHPRMAERSFVLYPLYDLCPELRLPNGTPLKSLLVQVDDTGLQRLGSTTIDKKYHLEMP